MGTDVLMRCHGASRERCWGSVQPRNDLRRSLRKPGEPEEKNQSFLAFFFFFTWPMSSLAARTTSQQPKNEGPDPQRGPRAVFPVPAADDGSGAQRVLQG